MCSDTRGRISGCWSGCWACRQLGGVCSRHRGWWWSGAECILGGCLAVMDQSDHVQQPKAVRSADACHASCPEPLAGAHTFTSARPHSMQCT